jgi:fibronectin-binding autotransporter adhesin
MKSRCHILVGSLLLLSFSKLCHGTTFQWSGSTTGLLQGESNIWNSTASYNWWYLSSTTTWPGHGSDNDAVFGGTAGSVEVSPSGHFVDDITFSTTGYTLSGGKLIINGLVPVITTDTGVAATISSEISGSVGPTKAGDGTLTLSGINTFTGVTTVSGGILKLGNAAALGTNTNGTTVHSGATFDINGQNLGTEVITIAGNGVGGNGALINNGASQTNALRSVVLSDDASIGGSSRWDLRNNNNSLNLAGFSLTKTGAAYVALVGTSVTPGAGNMIINQGELNLTQAANLNGSAGNSITVNSGGILGMYQSSVAHGWTLNLNHNSTLRGQNGISILNVWAGPVNLSGNANLLAETGHFLNISGSISGTGNLVLTGSGTTTLFGANNYSGNTTISAGELRLGHANALGTGTLTFGDYTILSSIGNTARSIANDVVFAGSPMFGNGSNIGKLTFTGPASITAAGMTFVPTSQVEFTNTISSTGAFGFTLNGSAALTLGGNNTYSGTTTLVNGNLRVASDSVGAPGAIVSSAIGTGPLVFDGGALSSSNGDARTIHNAVTINSMAVVGNSFLNGKLTFTSGINLGTTQKTIQAHSDVQFNGVISGAGAQLTVDGIGKVTLTNQNTYTGGTIVQGILTLGHATNTLSSGGTIYINGGTLDIGSNNDTVGPLNLTSGTITGTTGILTANNYTALAGSIDAIIAGNGTFSKIGPSTVTLSRANTNTGAMTISDGTLILSGNRTSPHTGGINVGNTSNQSGILEIHGNLPFGAGVLSVGLTNAGATGVVNHFAGKVSFASGNALLIGRSMAGVSGTYNLMGGEIQTFSSTARGVMIGVNDGSPGYPIEATFNLSGAGYLNNAAGTLQVVRGDSTASFQNSTYNQTGGTSLNRYLVIGGGVNGAGMVAAANGNNSTAIVSITGGTFSATTFSGLSRGDNVDSSLVIGGDAVVTLPAFPSARGLNSTATLHFDGGTLKPSASSTSYLGGLTHAFIHNAGATFDTNNFNITVSQSLLTDSISTGGGLTKQGSGILTLSGTNTYTGTTLVFGGALSVNGSIAGGPVTVQSGATLQGTGSIGGAVTVRSNGTLAPGNSIQSLAIGSLTLDANSTFAYEANKDAQPNLSGDLISISGNLNINLAQLNLTELGTTSSWSISPPAKLTLMSYSGTWNGGLLSYLGSPVPDGSIVSFSGVNWRFDYNDNLPGSNFIGDTIGATAYMTMSAVPEPSTAILAGLSGLLLLHRRRNQSSLSGATMWI